MAAVQKRHELFIFLCGKMQQNIVVNINFLQASLLRVQLMNCPGNNMI